MMTLIKVPSGKGAEHEDKFPSTPPPKKIHFQWDTLDEPLFPDDDLTMGYVLLMFAVDAVLYGLITWYVDNVKPGPFGQAKPFYFFVTVRRVFGPTQLQCCQLAFFNARFHKFGIIENDLALKISKFIYCFAFFSTKILTYCLALGIFEIY